MRIITTATAAIGLAASVMSHPASISVSVNTLKSSTLYVSTYGGSVQTLELTCPADSAAKSQLTPVAKTKECGSNPSWLLYDQQDRILYCVDEAMNKTNGGVYAFQPAGSNAPGKFDLKLLAKAETPAGPVSITLYGEAQALAIAHYSGSAISSFATSRNPAGLLHKLDGDSFTLAKVGPVSDRQEVAHPHQVVVDPLGKFILVPDLGADIVRIFSIDQSSFKLVPAGELELPAGSGPRHLVFTSGDKLPTHMYLTTELSNEIYGYRVNYEDSGRLSFTQVHKTSTHGPGKTAPAGAAAAEILVSPDDGFLIVSSRYDPVQTLDGEDSASDILISYSINRDTGHLTLVGITPSFGHNPRHMSLNKQGDRLAVVAQGDGLVFVIDRDAKTGELGELVAWATVDDQPNCIVWE